MRLDGYEAELEAVEAVMKETEVAMGM